MSHITIHLVWVDRVIQIILSVLQLVGRSFYLFYNCHSRIVVTQTSQVVPDLPVPKRVTLPTHSLLIRSFLSSPTFPGLYSFFSALQTSYLSSSLRNYSDFPSSANPPRNILTVLKRDRGFPLPLGVFPKVLKTDDTPPPKALLHS